MKLLVQNGKLLKTGKSQALAVEEPRPAIQIQIDSKVPQTLSVLPQVPSEQINTLTEREKGKIYIDINNTPSYITLQQIKELNTKTICVDDLMDGRVTALGAGDFVLVKGGRS